MKHGREQENTSISIVEHKKCFIYLCSMLVIKKILMRGSSSYVECTRCIVSFASESELVISHKCKDYIDGILHTLLSALGSASIKAK